MHRKIQCGNVCGPNSSGGERAVLCPADSHIPRFREREKERKKRGKGGQKRKREQKKESPVMIYVLLCRRRNKSSDLAQRGKQAIKHRINSELVPFFEKPQMS